MTHLTRRVLTADEVFETAESARNAGVASEEEHLILCDSHEALRAQLEASERRRAEVEQENDRLRSDLAHERRSGGQLRRENASLYRAVRDAGQTPSAEAPTGEPT